MIYLAYRFGGAAVVSIKADPKDLAAVERAAVSFLKRAHNESYLEEGLPRPRGGIGRLRLSRDGQEPDPLRFRDRPRNPASMLAGSLARFMLLNTRENPGRYLAGSPGRFERPPEGRGRAISDAANPRRVSIVPKNGERKVTPREFLTRRPGSIVCLSPWRSQGRPGRAGLRRAGGPWKNPPERFTLATGVPCLYQKNTSSPATVVGLFVVGRQGRGPGRPRRPGDDVRLGCSSRSPTRARSRTSWPRQRG